MINISQKALVDRLEKEIADAKEMLEHHEEYVHRFKTEIEEKLDILKRLQE